MSASKLFLVSTPIGNMADITLRALEVLRGVDLIAAEDTRHTGLLLSHHGIKNHLTSFHDFNQRGKSSKLLEMLKEGKSIAVVSDAGTPGISDPAYTVVNLAVDNNIDVFSIPGPTAFVSALVISGLPTDRFTFEGFLPLKPGKKRKRLEELKEFRHTLIFYESPHRLLRTLSEMSEILGNRKISVSRELTKKFEDTRRGRISEIKEHYQKQGPRGEFVLVVEGKKDDTE